MDSTTQLEIELANLKQELQTFKQEMQEKNKELILSKKETQSLKKQLKDVNSELQQKIHDLEKNNNDILNFINSTDCATLFLDKNLWVRRFTPNVSKFFNITPGDKGKPIYNLSQHFKDADFIKHAKMVITSLVPQSKEIQMSSDRWYIRRIFPFRIKNESVEGIFITFIDITERKKAESAFMESEGRFRRITENAKDMIYRMSLPKGKYEYVSRAAKEIFGYDPQDFYNNPLIIKKVIHPDWRDYFSQEWKNLNEGKMKPSYEYQVITSKGETKWVHQRNALIKDNDGKPIAIEGIVSDITDRKKTEELLYQSEKKYHSLYESMNEGMAIHRIIYDKKGKAINYVIEDVNQSYERILNMKKEDVINIPASELYKTRIPPFIEKYAKVAETGESIYFEEYFPPMDKYFAISVFSPLKGYFATVFSDITERIKMNQELKKQKELFEHAINAQSDTFFVFDPQENLSVIWNKAFEQASGYSAEEIKQLNAPESFYHKDDLTKISYYFQDILDGKSYPIILELIDKNGKAIPFEYAASPIQFSGEKNKYLIAIGRNISERLKSEKQLEASHQRFKKILENNTIPMVMTDKNWNIIMINKRFSESFGYKMKDITQTTSWLKKVYPNAEEKAANIQRWKKATEKASKRGYNIPPQKMEIICKDKSHKIVQIASVNIANENIISVVDITDQMVAQQNLEKALHEKEILLKEIHHRVKNNLQTVSSLLELQSYNVKDTKSVNILRDSINRVASMAEIHKQLYESDDIVNINFKQFIENISQQLIFSYQKTQLIKLVINLNHINLDINIAVPCGLVLNEIITNALKHAFPDNRKGHISISMEEKNSEYRFIIKDNGVGLPGDLDTANSSSMGLTLINHIVKEQLNGEVEFTNKKGTQISISFKKNPYPPRKNKK